MCAALAAPLPSSADLLRAMAGLTDLPDATAAGDIDPEASKRATERAAEAERLEAARAAALERAAQA